MKVKHRNKCAGRESRGEIRQKIERIRRLEKTGFKVRNKLLDGVLKLKYIGRGMDRS